MSIPTSRKARSVLGAGSALALALSATAAGLALNASATAENSTATTAPGTPATLHPGEVFHVIVTVLNTLTVPLESPRAQLNLPILQLVDTSPGAMSCTMSTGQNAPCGPLSDVLRANVDGDLVDVNTGQTVLGPVQPNESRTVDMKLKLKQDAPSGVFDIPHQFVGSNYGFGLSTPMLRLTVAPLLSDIGVSMTAATVGLLPPNEVRYAITATNSAAATTATQLTVDYPPGSYIVGGSPCTPVPGTTKATCDIGGIATNGKKTFNLTLRPNLLQIGPFRTTVTRTGSTPGDSSAANDTATSTCQALTSLLVRC